MYLIYTFFRVVGVETGEGSIKTGVVVNAAGAWGPPLSGMLGLACPTMAYQHAYAITDTIKGIANMPNVRDHDGSFYLRLQVNYYVFTLI